MHDDVAGKVADEYNVISEQHFESSRLRNEDSRVPVLVCMTFADRLLAEMLDKEGKYNEVTTRKAMTKHFEVSNMNLGCYHFSHVRELY